MATDVIIAAAARTPIGSFLGSLSSVPAPKLGATAIQKALADSKIDPVAIDQVIMGNVLSAGVGQAPARQAMIFGGIPKSTPAMTINKVCGSGLQAINLAYNAIVADESEIIVAGGMENMSMVPHFVYMRSGTKMGDVKFKDGMVADGLWDVYNDFHMGSAAEMCAKEHKFAREEQDRYAKQSFERAQKAVQDGAFKNEIVAVEVPQRKGAPMLVDVDEGPGKVNFDKMSKLRPAFEKDGTITAANASSISDGAAATVVMSANKAKSLGVTGMARIRACAIHAQDPEWFTTAPVEATRKALQKAGLTAGDIDLYEVNEAFAVVALATAKGVEIPEDKMNVHGGAISLGHPIGASGARVMATLLHSMQAQDKVLGLATLCIGGGEGIAMVVERI